MQRGKDGIFRQIRQIRKKLAGWLDHVMNDMSLRRKLILMYLLCMLLPLMVTDGIILTVLFRGEKASRQQEMKNTAEAISYSLSSRVEDAVHLARNIYGNRYVNEFLERTYSSPLEYYNSRLMLLRESLYETGVRSGSNYAVIYAENPTIVNGGYFCRTDLAEEKEWYRLSQESTQDTLLIPYYEQTTGFVYNNQKKLSLVQKMDYYRKGKSRNVLKVDLDYSAIIRSLVNSRYSSLVYVCSGDKILFSNDGRGGISMPFEERGREVQEKAGVVDTLRLYGQTLTICVMDPPMTSEKVMRDNAPLFFFLLLVNILAPLLCMQGFRRSFVLRLRTLGAVFEKQDTAQLQLLSEEAGKDEIGVLMRSYNHMAGRINELIQTVYEDKLREQEMDISRQQAELLALHSQINPHFLFNALESIRMHSVIKKEYETAEMVERLALMQRQNVEWGNDMVRVADEIRFAQAYLELQKYRFGERLSYDISVEADCREMEIPKLTLVTFVENACVHGIEAKTAPGWIFVRGYRSGNELCFEIEDTGQGMPLKQVYELQKKMNGAQIGQLKEKGRVGILNACLRLKMAAGNAVFFDMESEEGAGTMVTIRIHLKEGGKKEDA